MLALLDVYIRLQQSARCRQQKKRLVFALPIFKESSKIVKSKERKRGGGKTIKYFFLSLKQNC